MIDSDVAIGKNVKIFNDQMVNLFGCEIGDETFIGPFVEITRGVKIGKKCLIESHSFICTGVTLQDEVFVGHGVMFVNDLYPRTHRHVEYTSTLIQKGASLGSNATIIGGITIGEYAVVGAGSVVTRDVPPYSIVAGNPSRVRKQFTTYAEMYRYMESRQKIASPSK